MPVSKRDIETWLRHLFADKTYFGTIHAANLHDCLENRLVGKTEAAAFLGFCVGATSPDHALDLFRKACVLDGGISPRHYGLNPVDLSSSDPKESFAAIIRLAVFTDYIDSGAGDRLNSSAGLRRTTKRYQRDQLSRRLRFLNGTGRWAKPSAHLGRLPMGGESSRCCWFTTSVAVEEVLRDYTGHTDRAHAVRDRLGLIHVRTGDDLVLITFPGGVLQNLAHIRVAQPTFADGGNQRFAAVQKGSRYRENRKAKWGTTIDLEKFEHGEPDCCGLPERVCNPFPVDAGSFRVEYIGNTESTRGGTSRDDDSAFATWLLASRKTEDIINSILESVA